MWMKYVTRRLAVQLTLAWNYGWGKAMQRVYGISITKTLVFRDAKKTEYYVDQAQWDTYERGLFRLLTRKSFIRRFHKDALAKLRQLSREITNRLNTDLSAMTNRQLASLYQRDIWPRLCQFYVRMWTVFNLGEPLARTVERKLRQYVESEKLVSRYLLLLSQPLKPNNVLQERIDLLKIALRKGSINKKELHNKIVRHTKKYQHIPVFDIDHDVYTEKHFLKELKAIRNPRTELKTLSAQFTKHKTDLRKVTTAIRPDAELRKLIFFLKENVWLRDHRDMIRQKLNVNLRKFYQEIGKRLELPLTDTTLLTDKEIIRYLQAGKSFPKREIQRRRKSFLVIQRGNRVELSSGAQSLKRAKKEIRGTSTVALTEVRGLTGSPGKVRGRVRVVYTNKDLHKVKSGDILVAGMTRQDFVPAMRIAAATVTDEGGITCHAAIISREMRKPCIVGAKIAMQTFRDGDQVEVDATKGVVKRI